VLLLDLLTQLLLALVEAQERHLEPTVEMEVIVSFLLLLLLVAAVVDQITQRVKLFLGMMVDQGEGLPYTPVQPLVPLDPDWVVPVMFHQ
jgi:hypothetical protein